ncbi:MAG TPA: flagellar export protein FliJ [Desulfuromonadales bacterium]|nr:flagellar export protein FliJ [Desulfuromonadales bacterium]
MPDITFKLEQVLSYRSEMEKLRKQEFAVAKRGFEVANDELLREERSVEELTLEFSRQQQKVDCIDDIRLYADFFARKREELKYHKEEVEQLNMTMNERRADLMEASKDKQVLESLKEKKKREALQELRLKERNFLDEISVQKKVDSQ